MEYIDDFCYNLADYNVYIISIDALESVILSLKKLEEYEFVNQLSPNERENICRLIGKFAHMTKRRIQIDQFFTWQFLEILTKCETDLPKEFFNKVLEYEKAEKLNPPIEKRAKQISIKELENENKKLQKESEAKSIASATLFQSDIKSLPLYEDEK